MEHLPMRETPHIEVILILELWMPLVIFGHLQNLSKEIPKWVSETSTLSTTDISEIYLASLRIGILINTWWNFIFHAGGRDWREDREIAWIFHLSWKPQWEILSVTDCIYICRHMESLAMWTSLTQAKNAHTEALHLNHRLTCVDNPVGWQI